MNLKNVIDLSLKRKYTTRPSYFIHLFITEISIFYKISGAYNDRLMGLIEKKCAKYIKILITKARCTVHERGFIVSKCFHST